MNTLDKKSTNKKEKYALQLLEFPESCCWTVLAAEPRPPTTTAPWPDGGGEEPVSSSQYRLVSGGGGISVQLRPVCDDGHRSQYPVARNLFFVCLFVLLLAGRY